jgi:hypothetical protein
MQRVNSKDTKQRVANYVNPMTQERLHDLHPSEMPRFHEYFSSLHQILGRVDLAVPLPEPRDSGEKDEQGWKFSETFVQLGHSKK